MKDSSIECHLAYYLNTNTSLREALSDLSGILNKWIELVDRNKLRSFLIRAMSEDLTDKPPEWQNTFRVGLHMNGLSDEMLQTLLKNRFVNEVLFREWQISQSENELAKLKASFYANKYQLQSSRELADIISTLGRLEVGSALDYLVQETIHWAHTFNSELIRENAIAAEHYDEGMSQNSLRSHLFRSFYMFFTGG